MLFIIFKKNKIFKWKLLFFIKCNKNIHLTSCYSLFYFIVLKDSSTNSKISNSSSQIINIYNNYSDLSPKAKKEGFNMNNKKAPNERIAFKLFNVKLLDENKFNI